VQWSGRHVRTVLGGFNALQIAARQPPALNAIVAVCATDDLYADNMHYMGGCLLADNLSEATTMFAYNSCPPDPAIVGERWRDMWLERLRGSGLWLDIWLRHQRRDAFWRRASVCEDYAAIRCPVMVVGGWADGYTNAVFRLLEHLTVPRQGLVGPWGHKYPHLGVPGPAIGFLQEMRSWFDRWLRTSTSGASATDSGPILRAWMQHSVPPSTTYEERPGRWVAEQCWPSANVTARRLGLAPHRLLLTPSANEEANADVERVQSPLSLGLFAGKWCSYAAGPDLPFDQREEDGGALVYTSPPLEQPLEILGAPIATLELAVDRPVAQVCVRLHDVLPDGQATRVTFGVLNLTHRNGSERPEPLEPGRRYRVQVALNVVAQQFPRGHRLRLAISTSYWPLVWPAPEAAELTIWPSQSALTLPCRETHGAAAAPAFEPPETAEALPRELRVPERHSWRVHRDLALHSSELEVIKDNGAWYIPEIDLDVRAVTNEWYRSRGNDVASVEGETETVREFRRGDWHVVVRTRTRLTASPTHFRVLAELDAWEGDKRVFSENWDREIRRELV
jgi:uncharacterized protein